MFDVHCFFFAELRSYAKKYDFRTLEGGSRGNFGLSPVVSERSTVVGSVDR